MDASAPKTGFLNKYSDIALAIIVIAIAVLSIFGIGACISAIANN